MLRPNSPLLRIPSNLDRSQAIVLDGIRHAAEIVAMAYDRLSTSLASIQDGWAAGRPASASEPLMYAWSVVDAIERIRALRQAPFLQPEADSLRESNPRAVMFYNVKKVRDVNDHPYAKLEQVVAERAPAIGALRWLRVGEGPERRRYSCPLRLGRP